MGHINRFGPFLLHSPSPQSGAPVRPGHAHLLPAAPGLAFSAGTRAPAGSFFIKGGSILASTHTKPAAATTQNLSLHGLCNVPGSRIIPLKRHSPRPSTSVSHIFQKSVSVSTPSCPPYPLPAHSLPRASLLRGNVEVGHSICSKPSGGSLPLRMKCKALTQAPGDPAGQAPATAPFISSPAPCSTYRAQTHQRASAPAAPAACTTLAGLKFLWSLSSRRETAPPLSMAP